MGVLARRLEEIRGAGDDPGWLTRDDGETAGTNTAAGVRVNARVALGLTTVWRCVDLLSSSVSQAPKDIIVKVGGKSFPEFGKPSWLVRPHPDDPTYTANDYFGQVATSLLLDGNYFVLVMPSVDDPIVLNVLSPARVEVKAGPIYSIKDANGAEIRAVGPDQMLHGTWVRPAGMNRGISPLEVLRRAIGNAVGAEDHAGRFFGQGAALSFGVEVPGSLTKDQKTEMSENLRARYVGAANSHAIGLLTAGAKFVTGLAPTPEQAQMLATRKFSVEDLCRPYGVPPNMAGSQEPGASSYASADIWREEFRDYAALPLATRLESQHNRLVKVPDSISDPNASAQFKFNLDHVARTNILTRYQAYEAGVRGGFLMPDEVRALEDRQPAAGGDRLYMQSQNVPLELLASGAALPHPVQPPQEKP